jgi:hypothetical protein
VAQSKLNRTKALKRLRSAKAPVIRAGVITANIIWKAMKARPGMVAAYASFGAAPTPLSPR